MPNAVHVRSAETGDLVRTFEIPQIAEVSLSPLGTYLLSYTRLPESDESKGEGQKEGNLVVWEVKTGEAVGKFLQKSGIHLFSLFSLSCEI